jgi:hypothetical protein
MADRTGKPNLIYAHICEDVRLEMGDKVSLMGLFDSILAKEFPAMHPRLAVVAAWGGGVGEFKSQILLVAPGESHITDLGSANIRLLNEKQIHRHIGIHYNWKIPAPGIYEVRILLDGQLVRTLTLPVEDVRRVQ